MSAKVAFLDREIPETERRPLTAVHESALARRDGQPVVFLVDAGKARMMPVHTGQKINDLVTLAVDAAVLKAGDKVVAHPPDTLRDGDKIKMAVKP